MIGIINDGVKCFIIDTYGAEAWGDVVAATGIDKSYVSGCPYPDEVTYKALGTLAEKQGTDLQVILEDCGYHFCMVYAPKMGYERLLRCMGGSLIEFLQNLNIYHLHLQMSFKEMRPPAFNVDDVTPESLIFHYSSVRPGLTRFAVGLLRGAAKLLYDTEIEVTVLSIRGEEVGGGDGAAAAAGGDQDIGTGGAGAGVSDHDTFLIKFPPQASVMQMHCAAATCRLGLDPPTFFQLFPFHMVIDPDGRLVQVGRALSRMYPAMKPGRQLTDFFSLRHPYIPCAFENMLDHPDNLFVFRSCINGMELKGQMHYMQMPAVHADLSTRLEALRLGHGYDSVGGGGGAPGQSAAAAAAAVAALGRVAEEAGSDAGSKDFEDASEGTESQAQELQDLEPNGARTAPASHPLAPSRLALQHTQKRSPSRLSDTNPSTPTGTTAPPPHPNACPFFASLVTANASAFSAASGGRSYGAAALLAGLGGGPGGAGATSRSRRSSSSGGLSYAGQRHYQKMHPGSDVEPVLVFLGTPRIGNVEELRTYGLYVSDLPLFDHSREMVLMAEQRTAEAALKDTFERLSLQLEEERRRSEELLYQMIPSHIADSLRRGERVSAETYPEATILFSDIVNFTTIAAGCTAMEVCTMLDALYNEFDALLDKYPELYKVETIGDAYMLVANVTSPCPNHVDVVLDFALDMQTVCTRVTTNMGAPIQIRVGVHTGSVVGGVVGRKMPRFHLFGDAVNTASRMESHGLAGAVHISAASRALITDPAKYLVTERGEIAVKGKGLMETFLVSRANAPTAAHLRCILATSNSSEYACIPAVPAALQRLATYGPGALAGSFDCRAAAPPPPPTTSKVGAASLLSANSGAGDSLGAGAVVSIDLEHLQALAASVGGSSAVVGGAAADRPSMGGRQGSGYLLDTQHGSGEEPSVLMASEAALTTTEGSLEFALALAAPRTPAEAGRDGAVSGWLLQQRPPAVASMSPLAPQMPPTTPLQPASPRPPSQQPLLQPQPQPHVVEQRRLQAQDEQSERQPMALLRLHSEQMSLQLPPKLHMYRSVSCVEDGDGSSVPASSPKNPGSASSSRNAQSGQQRRVALRRQRKPSFYLRAPMGTPSLPQIELAELEAILQSRATAPVASETLSERELAQAATPPLERQQQEQYLYGSYALVQHQDLSPLGSGRELPGLSRLGELGLRPAAAVAATAVAAAAPPLERDSLTNRDEGDIPAPLRRLLPIHVVESLQQQQQQLARHAQHQYDDSAEGEHAMLLALQLRQRSFVVDRSGGRAHLVHAHQQQPLSHQQQQRPQQEQQQQQLQQHQQRLDGGVEAPQLPHLPQALVLEEDVVLLPYEDEFTDVRHRLTRRQEDYDDLDDAWF